MRLESRIARLEQFVSEDKITEFRVVFDDAEHDPEEWEELAQGLYKTHE